MHNLQVKLARFVVHTAAIEIKYRMMPLMMRSWSEVRSFLGKQLFIASNPEDPAKPFFFGISLNLPLEA